MHVEVERGTGVIEYPAAEASFGGSSGEVYARYVVWVGLVRSIILLDLLYP